MIPFASELLLVVMAGVGQAVSLFLGKGFAAELVELGLKIYLYVSYLAFLPTDTFSEFLKKRLEKVEIVQKKGTAEGSSFVFNDKG